MKHIFAGKFMKCIKCDKEAEFDSPKHFCENHWIEWWVSNSYNKQIVKTKEEKIREVKRFFRRLDRMTKTEVNKFLKGDK